MAPVPAFRHATPAFRTFSGDAALASLPSELDRLGVERAVVVGGRRLRDQPEVLAAIGEAMGPRLVGHFFGVLEHSPIPAVEAACDVLADAGADGVIAVGGGSAIVTARAATILLAESGDVRDLCTRRGRDGGFTSPRLTAPKVPNWVVPSTPVTAYAKAGSAVHDPDTGERLALFDPKTRAQGVFLDPVVALTTPEWLVRGAGLHAFAMAVESLQAAGDDPLTDALLLHALRMLAQWLPRLRLDPGDPEPRLQLMAAALLCGQGSDFVGGGLAQALSHATGPRSAAANGIVEAMLLPHTMRYNAVTTGRRLAVVADVLDHAGESAQPPELRAVVAVQALLADLDVPVALRDVDVHPDALRDIADAAMEDFAITRVPRPVQHGDVLTLLRSAW